MSGGMPGPPKLMPRPLCSTNEASPSTEKLLRNRTYQEEEEEAVDDTQEQDCEGSDVGSASDQDDSISEAGSNLSRSVDDDEGNRKIVLERARILIHQKSPVLEQPEVKKPDTSKGNVNIVLSILVVLLTVVVGVTVPQYRKYAGNPEPTADLNAIKTRFPEQEDDLWVSFESGVNDVKTFNRPVTYMLLYQNKDEERVNNLVSQLSKFAVCSLATCDKTPITLNHSDLNSDEMVEDYGRLIEKYAPKLQDNAVMVIRNLEKVKGAPAQAFHTICDEFTPLVEKSLIIFTLQVDEPQGPNKMRFLEDFFKKQWSDVKLDSLNALITRITSMVLEIKSPQL